MKNFKVALIGAGARGRDLLKNAFGYREYVEIVGVCDLYRDRCDLVVKDVEEMGKACPSCYTDYKKCLDETKPDIAVIATDWDAHIEVSIYAMEKEIAVACEVGGAYSMHSLWKLVDCYEKTKTPIMLLENCCYGRLELMALNMKRLGVLGKVVHCEGGYRHDLRGEVTNGDINRHYRLNQYIHRNCENYPTHEIGPIAKLLDINCGNRFLSLVSVGSSSVGCAEYAREKNVPNLDDVKFNQSDVVTTIIKCANGETITITLDTSLARYYSRGFLVRGTKATICEENRSVFIADKDEEDEWEWNKHFNNLDEFYKKYDHKLWENYEPHGGHGGMDVLTFDALFRCLDENKPMPIDVYDMATWMCISVLSEESIATGKTVYFPDFTNGKWIKRKNKFEA